MSDRRLTGRDVLAKTFHAKTKRGYDPVEVDAYLELVAAQIDVLHGDIGRMQQQELVAPAAVATVAPMSPELEAELNELRLRSAEYEQRSSELEMSRQRQVELDAELAQQNSINEAVRAENEQLRMQLQAIAPPPPDLAAAEGAAIEPVQAEVGNDRASEESFELMLRMAHRTAEETIAEAHGRADEIVAEAQLNATQIEKESDRKAFEATNRVQGEIASLNAELESQKHQLIDLRDRADTKRDEMRSLARGILHLADADSRTHDTTELDLRSQAEGASSDGWT